MNHSNNYSYNKPSWLQRLGQQIARYQFDRGTLFGTLMLGALIAFEVFNYTTTDYALTDFLGTVTFIGLRWSTILALAFCGMDFAGVARLFTPAAEKRERTEVWYLLGAWFLAATMNAMLTWWGVSLALLQHQSLGNEILNREQLLKIVPVFVAVLVWLIRILLIGTFSMAGERLFARADDTVRSVGNRLPAQPVRAAPRPVAAAPAPAPTAAAPRPTRLIGADDESDFDQRPRPTTPARDEVRRPVMPERPMPRPVAPPVPVVRPAPKPSASAAFAGGTNGAVRASALAKSVEVD